MSINYGKCTIGALRNPTIHLSFIPTRRVGRIRCALTRAHLGFGASEGEVGVEEAKATEALHRKIKDLQDRLEIVEGQVAQVGEKARDRAVALMSALQEPSTDKMEQLQMQGLDTNVENSLEDVMTGFTEVMAKGYLAAVEKLRDRMMVTEWELTLKPLAMRQGVSKFEAYCADRGAPVGYEVVSSLYEDPTNLDVIEDTALRLRARSLINQAVVAAHQAAYRECTLQARRLATQFSQGDFIAKILPEVGVLEALKSAAMPALKAAMGPAVKAVLPGN